jgi:hypothetical protein
MANLVRRLGAVLAALMMLATGAPALAQSAEKIQLAQGIARELFGAVDFTHLVAEGAKSSMGDLGQSVAARPEWSQMIADALNEQLAAGREPMEAVFARRLAVVFTVEELRAGQAIISDPAIARGIGASTRGEDSRGDVCSRPCMRAMDSPAGRAFVRKFGDTDRFFDKEAEAEFVAAIMPGFLRRLADKIESGERTRAGR